jgi:hypothetical protein
MKIDHGHPALDELWLAMGYLYQARYQVPPLSDTFSLIADMQSQLHRVIETAKKELLKDEDG